MNILKLTLVAAALTVGSSAAFADSSRAPQLNVARGSAMTVAMTRSLDTGAKSSATKSRPTIFGHDAAQSTYAFPYDHAASAGN